MLGSNFKLIIDNALAILLVWSLTWRELVWVSPKLAIRNLLDPFKIFSPKSAPLKSKQGSSAVNFMR